MNLGASLGRRSERTKVTLLCFGFVARCLLLGSARLGGSRGLIGAVGLGLASF